MIEGSQSYLYSVCKFEGVNVHLQWLKGVQEALYFNQWSMKIIILFEYLQSAKTHSIHMIS